jgi:hypothetical protein
VEEDFIAYANARMTESNDEEESMMPDPQSLEENMTNEKEKSLELTTPRIETGSNDVSNTPKKLALHSMFATKKDHIGDCQKKKQHNT